MVISKAAIGIEALLCWVLYNHKKKKKETIPALKGL